MLSLFAVPKAFEGHIGVIQRNAIRSWKRLDHDCQVILCGDDPGVAEAAQELQVDHIPSVMRNDFGTPLLSSAFALAEDAARHDLLCYANADLIFFPDLVDAVADVRSIDPRFMVVGRCRDLDVREEISDDEGWCRIRSRCMTEGVERGVERGAFWIDYWIDYFVFPRGVLGQLPPFAVGRPAWDNWMIWQGRKRRLAVVDATAAVMVVHQRHVYGHVAGARDELLPWVGPEGDANLTLTREEQWLSLAYATHRLGRDGVARVPESLRQRIMIELTFHSGTAPLHRALRRLLAAFRGTTDA